MGNAMEMRIVCGADLTPEGRAVAHVAAGIAAARKRALALVHVVEDVGAGLAVRRGEGALFDDERARLAALADEVARATGAIVDADVAFGLAEDVLARASERAELLVLGSTAARDLRKKLFGSVSRRTAREALAPVLIVRDAAPLLAWIEASRELRAVSGFDFSESARALPGVYAMLDAVGPTRLEIVHVCDARREHRRLGYPEAERASALAKEAESVLLRDLDERLGVDGRRANATLEVVATEARPEEAIVARAASAGADLVIIGSRQRDGLERLIAGSTSHAVLRDASTNVLCVPGGDVLGLPPGALRLRRICVACDFSPEAEQAVVDAFAAVEPDGEVVLVHVTDPAPLAAPVAALLPVLDPEALVSRDVAPLEARLRALVPPFAEGKRVRAEVVVASGKVVDEVLAVAERVGADVLAVGSRGRGALAAALVGSVTQRLIAASTRPVLVSRTPAR
jgi:nucleotide-binding universal stress UspA family protein